MKTPSGIEIEIGQVWRGPDYGVQNRVGHFEDGIVWLYRKHCNGPDRIPVSRFNGKRGGYALSAGNDATTDAPRQPDRRWSGCLLPICDRRFARPVRARKPGRHAPAFVPALRDTSRTRKLPALYRYLICQNASSGVRACRLILLGCCSQNR